MSFQTLVTQLQNQQTTVLIAQLFVSFLKSILIILMHYNFQDRFVLNSFPSSIAFIKAL